MLSVQRSFCSVFIAFVFVGMGSLLPSRASAVARGCHEALRTKSELAEEEWHAGIVRNMRRVNAMLQAAGITHQRIADAWGVERSSVSHTLSGHYGLSPWRASVIAQLLGIDIRELLVPDFRANGKTRSNGGSVFTANVVMAYDSLETLRPYLRRDFSDRDHNRAVSEIAQTFGTERASAERMQSVVRAWLGAYLAEGRMPRMTVRREGKPNGRTEWSD